MKCTLIVLLSSLLLVQHGRAQSSGVPARFEVAAIKIDPSCSPKQQLSPLTLHIECVTLEEIIKASYVAYADGATYNGDSKAAVVSGGPAWVRSEHYTIDAKAEVPSTRFQIFGPMTRALIEDRFKLKVHRTERATPVYELTVSKKGAKLQKAKEGGCLAVVDGPPDFQAGPIPCGMRQRFNRLLIMSLEAHGMTMKLFAARLGFSMDRDVVDATGLEGAFDFNLEFSPDSATPRFGFGGRAIGGADSPTEPMGPSIFSALEEQLGLKLQPAMGTSEVMVIDQVERPSEN